MLNLVRNEIVKLYVGKRMWMFVVILTICVVLQGFFANSSSQHEHSWKSDLLQERSQLQAGLSDKSVYMPELGVRLVQGSIVTIDYEISHDVNPNLITGWSFSSTSTGITVLINVYLIILASETLAGEFTTGTVHLLLVHPIRRWKILLSKYLSLLVINAALITFLLLISLVVGGIVFGTNGFFAKHVYVDSDIHVHSMPMFEYVLAAYGLKFISICVIATVAFMLSSIFRTRSISIMLSLIITFAGQIGGNLLSGYWWDKYLVFTDINLISFVNGVAPVQGMSVLGSIGRLLIYVVLFYFITWVFFVKRDVTV